MGPQPFKATFLPERVALLQRALADYDSLLPQSSVASSDAAPGLGDLGVDVDWLRRAAKELAVFDIGALERELDEFKHFTVDIEGATVHFVHEISERKDAVPLILLHGWPGTFWDFHKIIKRLAHPENAWEPAFHVVVPSLPGFAFSTLPRRQTFSLGDRARIFNRLMTEELGYDKYIGQGGDWGSYILREIASDHSSSAPLVHFNMFRCPPAGLSSYLPYLKALPIPQSLATYVKDKVEGHDMSDHERRLVRRNEVFKAKGGGYSAIQGTKPFTIGYAIATSPLALLAYIGEKIIAWSDPTPSVVSKHNLERDILATVLIYFLTDSFASSVMIYQQTFDERAAYMNGTQSRERIKSRVAFSSFAYEIGAPPKSWISTYCNLVQFKEHAQGGHFPAIDNPDGLVADLRELVMAHWWDRGTGKRRDI